MSIKYLLMIGAVSAILSGGCAFIAGEKEGEPSGDRLTFNYIETLRNQDSLRGESYRELSNGAHPAVSLQRPGSVYADQFRVYVVDNTTPPRLFVFDRGERTATILNITSPPSAEGNLLAPSGIVLAAGTTLFVSDAQLGRVFGYDLKGALVMVLGRGQVLSPHAGLGDLLSPSGLAVDDKRNRLYVSDMHAQQVKVFDPMGRHLFDIGNTGRPDADFKFPAALCLDRSGNVYVVDSLRLGVFIFAPDGEFLRSFSLKRLLPGHSIKPKGIAVDSEGHVYVVDAVNNNVLVLEPDGRLIMTWGRTGSTRGEFWIPTGIFIDAYDRIYIADQMNGRVQSYQYTR
jgi:sugar lactone lactonase YvrE